MAVLRPPAAAALAWETCGVKRGREKDSPCQQEVPTATGEAQGSGPGTAKGKPCNDISHRKDAFEMSAC